MNRPDPQTSRSADSLHPPGADRWSRLFRCETVADALAEAASWSEAVPVALALVDVDGRFLTTWGRELADPGVSATETTVSVPGPDGWRLSGSFAPSDAGTARGALASAAAAVEAWRAAHGERLRLQARLERRTRELDLIQTLGRRAAEASTPFELFRSAVGVLHQGEELDLVVAAHALDGEPEAPVFVSRPISDEAIADLIRRAGGLLGWSADRLPEPVRHRLDTYADDAGLRRAVDDHDLVVLPIVRRRAPVACLLVVPSGPDGDGALRLLYSATNQLSIHLDRIMAMREAEADRFRSVLDSMPQAVLLTDRQLRVQLANRSAERMLEHSVVGLGGDLGESVARLGLGDAVSAVRDGRAEVADAEVSVDGERAFLVTVSPSSRGPAGGLVLVWSDVTESRRLQRRLAQSEKLSSLGQMISGVAHELNNPLASILGFAQLLRAKSTDDAVRARLDTLCAEAERCRRIVQNLLSFARRRAPERRPVSINEVVQSVVALMGYQLRVDGVRIETDLASDVPALRGDVHELQQVLVNMLTNARHAIGADGGVVTVRSFADAGRVGLDVIDDGPGVPAALRDSIFDPFFTTKPEGKGTGLGLSLVFGIVEDHGGTVELLDRADARGAHFRVLLPVEGTSQEQPARVAGVSHEPARRPGRILVVDDEEPLATMICDALVEAGHRAEAVHDVERALERLGEATSWDLVVSDVKMPGMNGERLVEEVRRLRPELGQRIVLTTGDTLSDEAATLGRRTGLPVLDKPFDLGELRRVVAARLLAAGDVED